MPKKKLPQTIEEPMITRIDVEGGAILNYAVKGGARSLVELSWFVDDQLSRELLAVPGVQKVQRLGGVETHAGHFIGRRLRMIYESKMPLAHVHQAQ